MHCFDIFFSKQGARGSMVTIDALAKLLPASTTLYGLHDSGNYVNISPRDSSQDSFMEQCEKAYELYDHPHVNDKCADEYVQDTWKCLCGQYMLPLVETPSQIIFYLYDSYQLNHNIGNIALFTSCHLFVYFCTT